MGRGKEGYEEQKRKSGEKFLRKTGDGPAMEEYLRRYGKVSSWYATLFHIDWFFDWLKDEKHVLMSPDELVAEEK